LKQIYRRKNTGDPDKLEALNEHVKGLKGSGKDPKDDKDALWNTQIDTIMKKYKSFIGVVSRDEVLSLLPYVHKDRKICFVMNLSLEDSIDGGTHWVGVYIDPIEAKSVCYYDSFARNAPASLMKDLKQIVDKIDAPTFLKFKQNKVVQQSVNSSNCGWFVILWLTKMLKGESFAEATGFNDHVRHAVKQGEAAVERFKKLPMFKYI
jgi:hypothetical protein